ncbi:MAG: hypothetical protein ACMZ7B_10345 [Balneola sp.]
MNFLRILVWIILCYEPLKFLVFDKQKELSNLLNVLCVKMGFCIPENDFNRISNLESLTADEFVNEVFEAEGMNTQNELHLARQVKRRFTAKFGNQL